MMLTELATVPLASLPMQAFRDHLRLATGFADDALPAALIEAHLRAAIAAIEARIGKALLTRSFLLELEDWRRADDQPLPVAPVSVVESVVILDGFGGSLTVDPARYRLMPDMHRPRLVSTGSALPGVPTGGRVRVRFAAGFGTMWSGVPADLGQAVLMLGASYYDHRHEDAGQAKGLPFGVVGLIDRWRTVRVLGGGAA